MWYPFLWVSSTINATSNTYESNESSLIPLSVVGTSTPIFQFPIQGLVGMTFSVTMA